MAHYYSRCLNSKPNSSARIHIFSDEFDKTYFEGLLKRAAENSHKEIQEILQASYLGYIVIRPIPSVPIGRTVLAPLSTSKERKFSCIVEYKAHLCGIELKVDALAFQQQDRAVGACATTATWTALQTMARNEGAKTPTPTEITEAAVKHFIPDGRASPSKGLRVEQICDALRALNYPPVLIGAEGELDHFLHLLNIYLLSGIPIILGIKNRKGAHAVTIVGFRKDYSIKGNFSIDGLNLVSHNLQYKELYIHDDRMGPYARSFLKKKQSCLLSNSQSLVLSIEWATGETEDWDVAIGIVPLYKKIRTSAAELYDAMLNIAPFLDSVIEGSVSVEIFFVKCGEYLKTLFCKNLEPQRLMEFLMNVDLSRYIGIVRWYSNDVPIIDLVWDTTDTLRAETKFKNGLLAVVALDRAAIEVVEFISNRLGVPCC